MPTSKLRLGVGANCTIITRYLHPAKKISDKYVNFGHRNKMEHMICLQKENKVVNRCTQVVAVFQHADFGEDKLHAVLCWVSVKEEGNKAFLFTSKAVDTTEVNRQNKEMARRQKAA